MKKVLVLFIVICSLFVVVGCDKKESSSISEKKEEVKNTVVYDNDGIKVELDSKGEAFLTYSEVEAHSKSIATNVSNTAVVKAGQSDVCLGNSRLVFVSKEGTISYLNLDKLECGKEIVVKDVDNYKNIAAVYSEEKKVNDYEPILYKVFARDKDGNINDITNDLLK